MSEMKNVKKEYASPMCVAIMVELECGLAAASASVVVGGIGNEPTVEEWADVEGPSWNVDL